MHLRRFPARRTRPYFILLLSVLFAVPVNADPTPERALMEMDFFAEGRGMHLSPGLLNQLESLRNVIEGTSADRTVLQTLAHRWGLQQHEGNLVGIKSVRYRRMSVGVLGCVACHSGKAAGRYIVGIGNKNIDPGQIGIDGIRLQTEYQRITDRLAALGIRKKSAEYRRLEDQSIRLMKKLADPRMSVGVQGLVPVSLVGSWFYEMANEPLPTNGYKGATKVPSWFGFGKKLETGQFADAIGKGHPPGWIIGVEITSGQTPEAVRGYFSEVERATELISSLRPPGYPFPIRADHAARGKTTFEAKCAGCHGTYENDTNGAPIFQAPKAIAHEKVGTDPDRLDYVTEDFLAKVRASPLSDLIQLSEYAGKRMYVAPRLHAIWARFPYLHNASVPTLRDLLEPPSLRPKVFSVRDAGEKSRFDPIRVGLRPARVPRRKKRWVYDTSLPGQSNRGHEKGIDLTSEQKDELVEYLKTL
jgi:mono/diheme cytochrome c family protein